MRKILGAAALALIGCVAIYSIKIKDIEMFS
jgi:hypothetical protein